VKALVRDRALMSQSTGGLYTALMRMGWTSLSNSYASLSTLNCAVRKAAVEGRKCHG
jgi:hypothetical protein